MKFTKSQFFAILVLTCLTLQIALTPKSSGQNEDFDQLFDEEFDEGPVGTFDQPPPAMDFPDEEIDASAGFPADPPPPPDNSNQNFERPTNSRSSSPISRPSVGNTRKSGSPKAIKKKSAPTVQTKSTGKPDSGKPDISQAGIEDITNENYPDIIESFDYPNAEITDVIKAISQLTGKNFIIDPGVRGKISIVAPSQITVAEAYKAFLSALAIHGFTVVPSGKFLKVKSARNAQRDAIETYSGPYYPNADVMITRIVHLKHISAEEVNKRLRILHSKDGEMTPYEPTNSLIISDYGSNMERIMKVLGELDRPGFEEQLAVVPIRYAKAKDLADLITQIINKDPTRPGSPSPGFGAGVPRFRSRTKAPTSGTSEELSLVAPDDRTNAIIVVGNKAGIEKVRQLVRKLDYKLDPAEAGGVFVYYVKYGEAEKIAQTLTGLAQTSTSGAAGSSSPAGGSSSSAARLSPSPLAQQALFGGDVRITADKDTNSLVVTASKVDYESVRDILAKIDIPRDQVYVEGVIMEMASERTRDWNPTVYYLDPNSNGIGRAGYSRPGSLAGILNPAGDSGAILGFGSGQKLSFKLGDQTIEVPSFLSFLKFLQQNVEGNILSTPQILALDNEDAEIEVGDTIPVGKATSTGPNGISTSEPKYEKATIKLNITPHIRPDSDVVRLKITQTIKQVTDKPVRAKDLADSTVVTSDRSLKTNIVVHNGDTAVLGGLIRDEESVQENKIPILGDIPILGWLFKSKQTSTAKINLVIFLTPKIIRNTTDNHELLNRKTNERIDWLKKNFGGRDPYGKKIDTLPRANQEAAVDEFNDSTPDLQLDGALDAL